MLYVLVFTTADLIYNKNTVCFPLAFVVNYRVTIKALLVDTT